MGKHTRVATTAIASSKITTKNQVARDKTSLVTRSLRGSNGGSEYPRVHVDNQAPGGLSMAGCSETGVLDEGRKHRKTSAFNTSKMILKFMLSNTGSRFHYRRKEGRKNGTVAQPCPPLGSKSWEVNDKSNQIRFHIERGRLGRLLFWIPLPPKVTKGCQCLERCCTIGLVS